MNNDVIEKIARTCHEVNRAYCQALDDNSQLPWEKAPIWQKESARGGVQFLLDNPVAGPADCHRSWLTMKEQEGWKWGSHKDVDKKLHPCMVPYRELPGCQKVKDLLFRAVVRSMVL